MTTGTGLMLLGVWIFASCCVLAARRIPGELIGAAIGLAVGATIIAALES